MRVGGRELNEIYINGRFLSRPATGVERFARETIVALDAILADRTGSDDGAERDAACQWTLFVPRGTRGLPAFRRIQVRELGSRNGHLWEQIDLRRATTGGVLLNLCNSGPVLRGRQLVVLHDAAVYRHSEYFSPRYARAHRWLGKALSVRSRIGTVSRFSRGELADILKLDPDRVPVLPNGGEHVTRLTADPGVIGRLGLTDQPYFLFVSSLKPNKNVATALAAFAALERPDARLVIVGTANEKVFGSIQGADTPGVVWTGHVADEELTALYNHAVALVFPSLYEGFGLPLVEAGWLDCPILSSDIPPARELVPSADRFAPMDAAALTDLMRRYLDDPALRRARAETTGADARRFTWGGTARDLLALATAL